MASLDCKVSVTDTDVFKKILRRYRIMQTAFLMMVIFSLVLVALYARSERNFNDLFDDYEILETKYESLSYRHELQEEKFMQEIVELENRYREAFRMTKDYQELLNVVQGEALNQGEQGIMHVTSVVLNRVRHEGFGDNIHDVISASGQFCAYGNTYAEIDQTVIKGVEKVLLYGSVNDALYFMNPDTSSESSRSWMRTKRLALKHKDHEFYGEY